MLTEISITLHILLAPVAVLLMWVNMLGYRYSFTRWGTASWWFSVSMLALVSVMTSTFIGSAWWIWWAVYRAPDPLMLATGWPLIPMGIGMDIAFIAGTLGGLRSIQLAVHSILPASEHAHWPIWRAWLYPRQSFPFFLNRSET